jgi:ABC-type lipoprotein export system ATPase subunit
MMVELADLFFRYPEGDFALRVDTLAIRRGEQTAIIGPSGSGKTTLLNLVAGIRTPVRGRVMTGGVDVTRLDDAARRDFRIRTLGLVFQEFELLEYLSVLDNILLSYRINASLELDGRVRERAVELARMVGIGDHLARFPDRMSQGERQRVAVCRALLPEPPLLLADEPTGNLDPDNKGRVLDILFDYAEGSGATLLTVTHDHDLLARFGRVIDCKEFYDRAGTRPGGGRPAGEEP